MTWGIFSSMDYCFKKSTPPTNVQDSKFILYPNNVNYSSIYMANSLFAVSIKQNIPYGSNASFYKIGKQKAAFKII